LFPTRNIMMNPKKAAVCPIVTTYECTCAHAGMAKGAGATLRSR